MRENAQNGPSGVVHVKTTAKREPASVRAVIDDGAELDDVETDAAVLSREAVVLHANMHFVHARLFLIADGEVKRLVVFR